MLGVHGGLGRQRATPNTASSTPIRACPRSASASCCRRISPRRPPPISARAGRGARLRGASHRARRAARRARLHLWRRLPARDRHGPARRRRFRQGLLCRPGSGLAHGASRHRAHAASCRSRSTASPPTPALPVMAGDKPVGTMGSSARRRGACACCGSTASPTRARPAAAHRRRRADRPHKPDWATFAWPGEKACMSRRAAARRRPAPLPLAGQGRSALRRLSRRRMGRAGIRRPRALREADARRLPGRPVVDHDPAQARQFPPRLRRFRAGEDRALRRAQEGRS